jgi:hypothetical protein
MQPAEETARTRRFVGLAFRGERASRRSRVIGSGLDVWEIAQMLEDFGSIGRLVRETHLTEPEIRLAEAYRDEFPEEIAQAIAENRRSPEDLRSRYSFVELATNEQ